MIWWWVSHSAARKRQSGSVAPPAAWPARTLIAPSMGQTLRLAETIGCGPFGDMWAPVPDDQAIATVRSAFEAGVRYFDSAPLYGVGKSERRVRELPHRAALGERAGERRPSVGRGRGEADELRVDRRFHVCRQYGDLGVVGRGQHGEAGDHDDWSE